MRVGGALLLVLLVPCAPASAQGFKWWQSPAVQRDIRLTSQQVTAIDAVFQATLDERRAVRARLDCLETSLRQLLDDPDPDDAAATALIDRLEQTRARRNVLRTMMLYRMRRVLTPVQRAWFDMHAVAAPHAP